MKIIPAKCQVKHNFWENHVRAWKMSGFSQAEYCRKQIISLKSFVYWKMKLGKSELSTSLVEVPIFKTAQVLSHSKPLCLRIGNKFSIDIERDFDPETLSKILRVVEDR
jgi:hypothetical protein